jgi:rod shape determining protein RodA
VNIGVNLNVVPVSGLPLPFISYGGSSLLSSILGIGLVESVALRKGIITS